MSKGLVLTAALLLVIASAPAALAVTEADKFEKDNSPPATGPRGLLDCSTAIPAGCDFFWSGSNCDYVNNAESYSCHSYTESGPEVVFELVVTVEKQYTITMTPNGCDLDLQLLSGCDEALCIAFSAGVSTEMITQCLEPGTYYIVVEGYGGACCPFTLAISCDDCPAPVGGETCASCLGLECDGTFVITTDTSGSLDDYNPGAGNSCTGYSASGGDIVYCVCIPAGATFDATFSEDTYDGSIYLVTDCADLVGTCLDGDDCFPNPCIDYISYTNNTGGDVEAYLIIDGFGGEVGTGTLTYTLSCCQPIPTQKTTWGTLKRTYR